MNVGLYAFGRGGHEQVPARVRPNDAGVLAHGGQRALFLEGQNNAINFIEPGYPGQRLTVFVSDISSQTFNDSGGARQPGQLTIRGAPINILAGECIEFVCDMNGCWRCIGFQQRQNILQVVETKYNGVATGTTTMPYDDTIPQITEGNEFMNITMSPKDSASKLLVEGQAFIVLSVGNVDAPWGLFQDATPDAIAAGVYTNNGTGVECIQTMQFGHYISTSGGTGSRTYRWRCGMHSAGTTIFNGITGGIRRFGDIPKSWMRVTEFLTQF